VPFWEHLLDAGYHLTAIGGSDSHDAGKPAVSASQLRAGRSSEDPQYWALLQSNSGAIGVPTTVVHATALSQDAILAGLRSGRVFIDLEGSTRRTLDLDARSGPQTAHMGDTLAAPPGQTVRFDAQISGLQAAEVQLIIDGHAVAWNGHIQGVEDTAWSGAYTWRADGRAHWARLTVRDAGGHTVLIGNPIYLQGKADGTR
jgi:hypothetical protein